MLRVPLRLTVGASWVRAGIHRRVVKGMVLVLVLEPDLGPGLGMGLGMGLDLDLDLDLLHKWVMLGP